MGTEGCDAGVPGGLSEQGEGALEAGEMAEAKAPQGRAWFILGQQEARLQAVGDTVDGPPAAPSPGGAPTPPRLYPAPENCLWLTGATSSLHSQGVTCSQ